MTETLGWVATVMAGAGTAGGVAMGYGSMRRTLARWRVRYTLDTQAGLSEIFLFVAPHMMWRINLLVCAIAAVISWGITGHHAISLGAAVMAAPLPRVALSIVRQRRVTRIDGQLPDATRGMAAALRAGASLPAALRWVADHTQAPLAQEIGLVLREQRVGVPFAEALAHFEARLGTEAIGLLTATLRVAATTGGDLSCLLDQFSRMQRRRLQVDVRVRTLTSQGRVQAVVVGALPVLLLIVLSVLAPDMMAVFWYTSEGWAVLALIGLLELCGGWLIRRIVRIRV